MPRVLFLILTYSQGHICRYTSHNLLMSPVYDIMLCVVQVCSKFCAALVATDRLIDSMMQHNEQVRK